MQDPMRVIRDDRQGIAEAVPGRFQAEVKFVMEGTKKGLGHSTIRLLQLWKLLFY